jgi:hypothetical protein
MYWISLINVSFDYVSKTIFIWWIQFYIVAKISSLIQTKKLSIFCMFISTQACFISNHLYMIFCFFLLFYPYFSSTLKKYRVLHPKLSPANLSVKIASKSRGNHLQFQSIMVPLKVIRFFSEKMTAIWLMKMHLS